MDIQLAGPRDDAMSHTAGCLCIVDNIVVVIHVHCGVSTPRQQIVVNNIFH